MRWRNNGAVYVLRNACSFCRIHCLCLFGISSDIRRVLKHQAGIILRPFAPFLGVLLNVSGRAVFSPVPGFSDQQEKTGLLPGLYLRAADDSGILFLMFSSADQRFSFSGILFPAF